MAVANFLSPNFQCSEELRKIRIDCNQKLKYCKVGTSSTVEEVEEVAKSYHSLFSLLKVHLLGGFLGSSE